MSIVTLFEGFTKPIQQESIYAIITEIRGEKYATEIQKLRNMIAEGKIEEANKLKRTLPAFTPSGTFLEGRTQQNLDSYSGIIVLDFDKITGVNKVFEQVRKIPYTSFAFKSPSGNGLKIFVRVTSASQEHKLMFAKVADYYEQQLSLLADRSGSDITRLCFVSHDPEAYINEHPEIFEEQHPLPYNNYNILFQKCIQELVGKQSYTNGNRNNFIYILARKCNLSGIPIEHTLELAKAQYDLAPLEIQSTIKSAYQHHTDEFGKHLQIASDTHEIDRVEDQDYILLNMPTIPVDVFDQLPDILKSGCNAFDTIREKDMFLTGALTILSGCLHNVQGTYDQRTVYPNLNCFIVAPAASGKGAFSFAKVLGNEYHRKLLRASIEAKRQYDLEMQQYKHQQKIKKKSTTDSNEEEPVKPPFKVFFIPGNSSSAAVIQHLMDSGGKGVFCETEADTVSNSLKQDWGGYSDLLRKAFHHECVSYSRKTNNEYFEIASPQLSMALSGTHSQVAGLISSAEDGLFSRIIFYVFKTEVQWRDVAPKNDRPNLNTHFDSLSLKVLEMIEFLEANPTEFCMTVEQWQDLNTVCSTWLKEVSLFISEEATSTVKRLGLIFYRIAMIITSLRKYENGDASRTVTCDDIDFQIALKLAKTYKEHALYMFQKLPKNDKSPKGKASEFLKSLPLRFKRIDAINCGAQLKIKHRTIDKYLKEFLTLNLLKSEEYGLYEKIT